MQDPERWKRLEATAPSKPVMLYPRPTVFSAHPLISLVGEADELIGALMNEAMLELAWEDTRLPRAARHNRQDAKCAAAHANARRD